MAVVATPLTTSLTQVHQNDPVLFVTLYPASESEQLALADCVDVDEPFELDEEELELDEEEDELEDEELVPDEGGLLVLVLVLVVAVGIFAH